MRVNKSESTSYSVPALDKGLDLLEALSVSPVPMTLTDLARTLNRSTSVLFRVVDALEKRQYIARDPVSGGYRLTLKLFELAHTHSPVDQLLRAALIPMRQLADAVYESCHLAILNQRKLVTVAEELSPDRVRLSIEVGSQVSPVQFASGRLLIAFLKPDEQQFVLEADPDYREMSRAKHSQLQEQLKAIRKTGYFMLESATRTGIDLSVIVGNPDCGISASLAIAFLAGGRNHGREKDILPVVQEYASRITNAIGLTAVTTEKGKSAGTQARAPRFSETNK
jgi:DNA-binding IclR family transcriptional regulator